VPVVSDGDDNYVVFETELEAQKEIADNAVIRLRQFLDGERDFDDAITVEEIRSPGNGASDGNIYGRSGNCFGAKGGISGRTLSVFFFR